MPAINAGALSLYEIAQRSIASGESIFTNTANPTFSQNVWYTVGDLDITVDVPSNSVAFIQFQSSINPDEPPGEVRTFQQRFVHNGNAVLEISSIQTYVPDTGDQWNGEEHYFPLSNIGLIENLSSGNHTFRVQIRTTDSSVSNPKHSELKHIATIMKR